MNQEKTILLLNVALGVTLIAFGFLVRYYRNEIKRLFNSKLDVVNQWNQSLESWNETINEVVSRGNKILELVNLINILKNHNSKYSKICRKLYDENQNLKVEYQYLQEKITELENKKLKPKPKK